MNVPESVEILIENLDEADWTSLLNTFNSVAEVRKGLAELEEMLRTKIRVKMKESNWDRYEDKQTGTTVSLTKTKREIIDKSQLKIMLTDTQLAQVTKTTTSERLIILTKEMRKRLSANVRKKNKPKKRNIKERN